MKKILLFIFAFNSCQAVAAITSNDIEYVSAVYKNLHAYPELSNKEFKTASYLASELRKAGFAVEEQFGGTTGIVAVLHNGKGRRGYLRADMDGLPITEKTGVDFSSKNKGVMHGCGHDFHMAAMIGYARYFAKNKNTWKGTLVLVGQPAEELGQGAKAMLQAGLYQKYGRPDYVLGLHISGRLEAGKIGYRSGPIQAGLDFVDIRFEGKGAHGSRPEDGISGIDMAADMVLELRELSKEFKSREKFVFAFGAMNSGRKHNIIPPESHLQANIRGFSVLDMNEYKQGIEKSFRKIIKKYGVKSEKQLLQYSVNLPPNVNDSRLVSAVVPSLKRATGDNVQYMDLILAAEDFAYYKDNYTVPTAFFFVGGRPKSPPENWGGNHNPYFMPDYKTAFPIAINAIVYSVQTLQK